MSRRESHRSSAHSECVTPCLRASASASWGKITSGSPTCDSSVFVNSDVLEVFLAPVLAPTDNPRWYYELDASPSGVLWAGLSNNSKGNASTCVAADGCTRSGTLPCRGRATFEHGLTVSVSNGTGTYSTQLLVPWALFAARFRPRGGEPWPHWRLNFYRYDYPRGPSGDFELTAWSPTHDLSFVTCRGGAIRDVKIWARVCYESVPHFCASGMALHPKHPVCS